MKYLKYNVGGSPRPIEDNCYRWGKMALIGLELVDAKEVQMYY